MRREPHAKANSSKGHSASNQGRVVEPPRGGKKGVAVFQRSRRTLLDVLDDLLLVPAEVVLCVLLEELKGGEDVGLLADAPVACA